MRRSVNLVARVRAAKAQSLLLALAAYSYRPKYSRSTEFAVLEGLQAQVEKGELPAHPASHVSAHTNDLTRRISVSERHSSSRRWASCSH